MYYQSQPGGFYGAQLGNIGGMPENTEDVANSFVVTPGGDARRARKGLTVPAVNRLLEANPEFKKEIEDMYLPGAKATNFLKAEIPGSSNLIGAIGNMGGLANSPFTQTEAPFGEVAGILDGIFGRKSKPLKPGEKPTMDELGTKTGERMMERKRATEEALKMLRGGSSSNEVNPFEALLAQNQGPSSPVKYYPDANKGQGGYLLNTGAGRIGEVRPRIPLA